MQVKQKEVSKDKKLEELLIENFVSLQKVMVNLSGKFDNLADQMSKLLQLFEIAAKSFVEKQVGKGIADSEKDKELIDKLNLLMDQNKTIARGLTLMEQKIRERVYGGAPAQEMPSPPVPRRDMQVKPLPSIMSNE